MGSTYGGHYTAIAYNDQTEKYYNFNDSSAHETRSGAYSDDAYILIYRRAD